MDDLEKNTKLKIEYRELTLEGRIFDIEQDRITISLSSKSIEASKSLKELDEVSVSFFTTLGVKKMDTSIMVPLHRGKAIIIERRPIIKVEQRREFVRVNQDFVFLLSTIKNRQINCRCVNISAGGIAFKTEGVNPDILNLEDEVTIILPQNLFEKDIILKADIIKKTQQDVIVAKYKNLNPRDEDKIVKYAFKVMTKSLY